MSTLKVTNIQATGETASRAVSGVAAAWVNFNGTGTIAIRDSVNVASLTDNGTGDYTVNFNNNMGNANYSTVAASAFNAWAGPDYTSGTLTGSVDVYSQTGTHTRADRDILNFALNGDLA